MSVDVFSLTCPSLAAARLVGFKGIERISRPYEFQLFLTLPSGTDVRSAVGARATLTADRGTGSEPMRWHGVVARIRMLRHVAERVLYQVTLVPRLWMLRHSVRSCVHTKETLQKFLTDTLKHGGLTEADFRFRIDEARYPEEEFVCQYRESHLDFVHRWMEREGLYYFFEQQPAEAGREVLVIVDDKGRHQPLAGDGRVRYFPSGGADVSAGEGLHELVCDFSTLPASVLVTDYNYENPAAPVEGEQAVAAGGLGQVRDYGYRVFDEAQAKRLAAVKAQSLRSRELVVQAGGNVLGLRAGYRFEIDDLGAEELPTHYLAVETVHAGSLAGMTAELSAYTGLAGDETYAVEVRAIPADVQYRSPQHTPWPRIYGFENAVIDGSAQSQYAQIDEQGRYLVRFKFDASTLQDGSASTYLRMAQPHGGTSEGWHFPLRKGTEVMVAFQGGDPDRPVISGVVPNAHRPSPVTSHNYTMNVLRTGGLNHLQIQDLEGEQYIDLFTPTGGTQVHLGGPITGNFEGYDGASREDVDCKFWVYTAGNAGYKIGGGWWEDITGGKKVHVAGPVTIGFDSSQRLDVKSSSTEHFHADRVVTIDTGRTDTVAAGGWVQNITGGLQTTVTSGGGKLDVTGTFVHKVRSEQFDDYSNWRTHVGGYWNATFEGPVTLNAAGQPVSITADQVEINGSEVTVKGSALSKVWAPWSLKFYGTNNAIGVQKLDMCALKLERTGIKIGMTSVKADHTIAKINTEALRSETKTLSSENAFTRLEKAGLSLATAAFRKL